MSFLRDMKKAATVEVTASRGGVTAPAREVAGRAQ